MAAFDFPSPPVDDGFEVTNDLTGITYKYVAASDSWVAIGSSVQDNYYTKPEVNNLIESNNSAIDERLDALEGQPEVNLENYYTKPEVNNLIETNNSTVDERLENYYTKPEVNNLIETNNSIVDERLDALEGQPQVNLENYYTKDETDNLLALRGVGYNYLISGFDGRVNPREGELYTNNRIAGQVTLLSVGLVDNDNKRLRNSVVGDTIEIYSVTHSKYYRYLITDAAENIFVVTWQGSTDDRDDAFEMGNPCLVYLYPTHLSQSEFELLEREVDQNEEQLQAMSINVLNALTDIREIKNLDITTALSELSKARQDIIELKSKVQSLELTSFLTLE